MKHWSSSHLNHCVCVRGWWVKAEDRCMLDSLTLPFIALHHSAVCGSSNRLSMGWMEIWGHTVLWPEGSRGCCSVYSGGFTETSVYFIVNLIQILFSFSFPAFHFQLYSLRRCHPSSLFCRLWEIHKNISSFPVTTVLLVLFFFFINNTDIIIALCVDGHGGVSHCFYCSFSAKHFVLDYLDEKWALIDWLID